MIDFVPRKFQQEAFECYKNFAESKFEGNPILSLFTGLGKSYLLAMILAYRIKENPDYRAIILCHSTDVLLQDEDAFNDLIEFYGISPKVGVYSAKVGIRQRKQITFASINSVYKKPELFDIREIFIDECHLVGTNKTSMYRTFLAYHSRISVVGLTATPFRMGSGLLTEMDNNVFTEILYNTLTPDKFEEAIELGYLCRPIAKHPKVDMDVSGVKTVAGDFSKKQLSEKLDRNEITEAIVADAVKNHLDGYKHIKVFCIDKEHAENVSREFNKHEGFNANFVHSTMEDDKDEAIQSFREGKINVVCSVMQMTTGVDLPMIDCIISMRPTKSVVIHIQSIGRGVRSYEGKDHCLILDYAGNLVTNGPIDNPVIHKKRKGEAGGEMPVKECPECGTYNNIGAKYCINDKCNHEFTFKETLSTKLSSGTVLSNDKKHDPVWHDVTSVAYYEHKSKATGNMSMRVAYLCGLRMVQDWISIGSNTSAGYKARFWWDYRSMWRGHPKYKTPTSLEEALYRANNKELREPKRILIDDNGKYPRIINQEF